MWTSSEAKSKIQLQILCLGEGRKCKTQRFSEYKYNVDYNIIYTEVLDVLIKKV